jgi:hypothetical protein
MAKKDDKCDAIICASFFALYSPAIIKLNGKGWMAQKNDELVYNGIYCFFPCCSPFLAPSVLFICVNLLSTRLRLAGQGSTTNEIGRLRGTSKLLFVCADLNQQKFSWHETA